MIRVTAVLLLAATGIVSPQPQYFRYDRSLTPAAPRTGLACAALPAEVFAHAAPGLTDLRLYRDTTEVPFVLRTLEPTQAHPGTVPTQNLGTRGGQTVFDAAMPPGTYNDINLGLDAQNYIATVSVSGTQSTADTKPTQLGSFTLFDLTSQRLGRSTVLHLADSDFRFLHFAITGPLQPDQIQGLSLPAQSAAESTYTPAVATSQFTQKDHSTVAEFTLPAHIPAGRLTFTPGPQPPNFSRDVTVSVRLLAEPTPVTDETTPPPIPSVFTGNLLRLHRKQDGQQIDEDRLSLTLNAPTLPTPTRWTVTLNNGDDPPIAFQSVRLEFEQQNLCFDATQKSQYHLAYGDPTLPSPQYDYARLFTPLPNPTFLTLGPEHPNPAFTPRPDERPFTEQHPALLWIALLAAIVLLGILALRSSTQARPAP